jgi:hypothetical protein
MIYLPVYGVIQTLLMFRPVSYQATLALTGIARGIGGAAAREINKIPADRP